jgi:hypothetical protein
MNPLTDPTLLHLFGGNRKNQEYLCHNLPKQFPHVHSEFDSSIDLQTLQEKLNTFEKVHDRVMTCDNILRRLGMLGVRRSYAKELEK